MSETPTEENPFAGVTWPESYPDATQSADNGAPAVTTLPDTTPAKNGVSGVMQTRIAPNGEYIPLGMEWSEEKQKVVPMGLVREELSSSAKRGEYGGYPTLKEYREAQAKRATDALNEFAESWGPAIDRLDKGGPWGPFADEETRKKLEANGKRLAENLEAVMRACNTADESAPATGTEAQVCRDIAKRQRRGLAKYGVTVIGNNLSFAQWLQNFYEELLDASVYAKRILTQMNHEPENQKQHQDDAGVAGVLHRDPPPHHGIPEPVPIRTVAGAGNDSDFCAGPVARHRKPGAGRKPKPCPNCGATKSIGSTVKNGIPTRRCKQCGFVVQTYPHLANVKAAE